MPNKLSQFWQELKRRNVVRVITVYAGAAFIIIELVDIVAPNLGLPSWTFNLVLILLLIGFVVTVIVSWIYDILPEGGIVKAESIQEIKAENIPKSSNSWKIASYISFVVIVGLIVLNIIPRIGQKNNLEKSIAVLPFRNESSDQDNIYFINAIMESMLDNLCKIEDLRVVSRNSVEQYRNNPIPTPVVAEEMNVSYIIEGSGVKLGNRIILTIQLIDGKNDQHLWSRQYDREIQKVEDLIDIQSEIAQLVAAEIKAVITPSEKELIEKIPTTSLTAYDFYQRGREEFERYWLEYLHYGREYTKEALERAEDLYYEALEYDSTFALAYTGLARVYAEKNYWEEFLNEDFLDSVLILADIALSNDNQLAEAYFVKGYYYERRNQKEKALNEYNTTIKLNPNYWEVYWRKGMLYQTEDMVKSIDNLQKAILLHRGPSLPEIYRQIGFVYGCSGFKERNCYYVEEAFKLDGDSAEYYDELAFSEEAIGNFEKAIEYDEIAYTIDSTRYWIIHHLGSYHSYLGRYEESLRYFRELDRRFRVLGQPHPFGTFQIGHAYWMNGLKDEAEYYFNTGLEIYNEAIDLGRESAQDEYRLAAAYAFLGDKEKAFEHLRLFNREQIVHSYISANIKNNPLFDRIRDEPEFQQVVRDVEAKYQAEHERVRQWLEENEML